jgi:molybdopterin converting factor small subunit
MFNCTVELYGISKQITTQRQVEVELNDGASLADLIAALRRRIPALDGTVFHRGEDRLSEFYAFNINGRFYIDDKDIRIHEGDRIALLSLAAGG